MKEILSTDKFFQENHVEFKDLWINVEKHFSRSGAKFYNCTFTIIPGSQVELNGCAFIKCKFVGTLDDPNDFIHKKSLKILAPTLVEELSLEGMFTKVVISNSSLFGFNDTSESDIFRLENIDIFDFNIRGKCEILTLDNCFFTSKKKGSISYWDKEIQRNASCQKVVFDSVKINPYFLASKCPDKSSIDLANATLVDNWSRLRKKYSGIQLYIILLLTFLFFLPLITKAFMLILASSMNDFILSAHKVPLWKVIFFNNESGIEGFTYFILTFFLILYTMGRFIITLRIAKLREEELFLSDSKFQLISIPPNKYLLEMKFDRILNWLFVFAVLYSIYKLIETLFILVPISYN